MDYLVYPKIFFDFITHNPYYTRIMSVMIRSSTSSRLFSLIQHKFSGLYAFLFSERWKNYITNHYNTWHRGVVAIIIAQIHSIKPELRFWEDSNRAHGLSEVCYGENS